jgi:hypothetical protein
VELGEVALLVVDGDDEADRVDQRPAGAVDHGGTHVGKAATGSRRDGRVADGDDEGLGTGDVG